jgi:hypothetical protein
MNIPLEAPSDQFDLLREPGEAVADDAQRDLFEFFSAPLPEEGAPVLAADAAPAAEPDPPAATIGEFLARHEEVPQDEPLRCDVSQDEPARREECDEVAAVDRCESATGSAPVALDEVSRANLRRLEETVSWLQSEANRLPPAAPLPPVPGLPALEPIIDRATLDRTLQRSTTLPIWLQEQQTRPQPPPLRERGVFWPRAVKFVMACGIAAPLSYYFAVATSPLHKRLIDSAGVASLDSPVASAPPAQRPSGAEHGLRVGVAGPELASAETRGVAPGQVVQTTAARLPPPEHPIQSSTESAPAEAPAAQAPVTEAQETAAQVVATRATATQVIATRATEALAVPAEPIPLPPTRPPQVEAALAPIVPPPATTGVAADMARSSPPRAEGDSAPAAKAVDLQEVKLLVDRGKQFFEVGDLIAARLLFLRAANAGDAAAAVAMGATYDPVVLSERGVRGVTADLEKARSWYERAKEMGSPEGPRRLEMLANR